MAGQWRLASVRVSMRERVQWMVLWPAPMRFRLEGSDLLFRPRKAGACRGTLIG